MSAPERPRRAVRPKDAATLILVRHDGQRGEGARVLMGQRHSGHVFMPEKFVFPGGQVDPGDHRIEPARGLRPSVEARVAHGVSRARARALAMAAVRETFEETGLIVGRRTSQRRSSRSPAWAAFLRTGVLPDLAPFEFVARAITPRDQPRRFDARFFMTDASAVQGEVHESPTGSGELLELSWVSLDEARRLDLPAITRVVIDEVAKRLQARPRERARIPVPFYRWSGVKPVLELLR